MDARVVREPRPLSFSTPVAAASAGEGQGGDHSWAPSAARECSASGGRKTTPCLARATNWEKLLEKVNRERALPSRAVSKGPGGDGPEVARRRKGSVAAERDGTARERRRPSALGAESFNCCKSRWQGRDKWPWDAKASRDSSRRCSQKFPPPTKNRGNRGPRFPCFDWGPPPEEKCFCVASR